MKQAEFVKALDSLGGKGEPYAVATVIRTEGSTQGKPGFKILVSSAGEVLGGSLGGVCPESAIASIAEKTMRTGSPKTVKVFLESVEDAVGAVIKNQNEDEVHVETNCGGVMEIYIEPYLPPQRLILVGRGGKDDVEEALVRLGKILDFDVVVIDHSPMLSEQPDQLIKDADFDLGKFNFSGSDSVVVLTHGERDVETLQTLSKIDLRYVGLLGSVRRVKGVIAGLREKGVGERFIGSLRAPVGADIGATTPAEIALSIMTEITATRHGKELPRKGEPENPIPPRIQKEV